MAETLPPLFIHQQREVCTHECHQRDGKHNGGGCSVQLVLSKYALLSFTPGLMVSLPGFHPAGHTSPCLSVNWKACTRRSVSSTERPTGRSFMVICRRLPLSSMMNSALNAMPWSSFRHPYWREISMVLSARRGICMVPIPPCLRGVLIHAKCENSLSVDAPITSQLMLRNSSTLSLTR